MRVRLKESEGLLAYPDTGSVIEALPGGANKVRGKVPSLIVLDEFAMHEEAWGEWTAVAPLVQKGMKLLVISTPNGSEGNCFYHLYHGTPKSIPVSG
jgi:phage FluMu gp28-like protein